MFSGYKGEGKRIEDIDLPRIGGQIGVGEDVLHALLEVETSGSGFDKQGRVKMLFEPHLFYRELKGEERERAVAAGLAYPKWKRSYPPDSYPRLIKAMEINEAAALKSASWGLGQVLGKYFRDFGFDSPQAMVQAFADDEEAHLQAMVDFIKTNRIDDDLRRIEAISKAGRVPSASDWVPVVRTYNGAGYAENNYHNRAANAYRKWLHIKDTEFAPKNLKQAAELESLSNMPEPDSEVEFPSKSVATEVTPSTDDEAVVVKGDPPRTELKPERPGLISRLTAIGLPATPLGLITMLKGATSLDLISIPREAWIALGILLVVCVVAGVWFLNKSLERADRRNERNQTILADDAKHNVIVTAKAEQPQP